MTSAEQLEWKFVQSFGDDNSSDDDLVTAVEFDETGDYLAVGDKAGRICIFEGCMSPPSPPHALSPDLRPPPPPPPRRPQSSHGVPVEYKFYTEFQSHEPEFDCLKSLEIEEKINDIRWAKRSSTGLFLLATNDKTVKLWKVYDKTIKRTTKDDRAAATKRAGAFVHSSADNGLTVPRLSASQSITTATPKRVYANAHGYHINSLAMSSDAETFVSCDDLRINLWSLDVSNESFCIVDLKPSSLEELTEVITACSFHPSHCSLFMYSTSRGSIRLVDMRDNALCDHHAKQLEADEDVSSKSFFSEIVNSISDCAFSTPDGRHVVSRDFLTVKLWDVNMEARPLAVLPVHDYLRAHLNDLYENDCIFDKFELSCNHDGTRGISGSYNNHFVVWDATPRAAPPGEGVALSQLTIEALKDGPRRQDAVGVKAAGGGSPAATEGGGSGRKGKAGRSAAKENGSAAAAAASGGEVFDVSLMDFGKKALHVAWHPRGNAVAVAGLNRLFIYQGISTMT